MGISKQAEPTLTLTPQQVQAAFLLASGKDGRSVAETLGISEGTIYRWRREPAFRAEINRLLNEMRTANSNRLTALAAIATNVIEEILLGAKDPKLRLEAALKILDLAKGVPMPDEGLTDPCAIARLDAEKQLEQTFWP